jgi:hypothetical protein
LSPDVRFWVALSARFRRFSWLGPALFRLGRVKFKSTRFGRPDRRLPAFADEKCHEVAIDEGHPDDDITGSGA